MIEVESHFLNPILSGDYPDPSVLRDGNDYYMTHSAFMYGPGLLIWHSQDLVNWEPVCNANEAFEGNIWAPDFIKYKDTFYIYYYADGANWVISAPSVTGPWCKPVKIDLWYIDPGHAHDDEGNRYLFFDRHFIKLTDDGMSLDGELMDSYGGWEIPEDFVVEYGFGVMTYESSKITRKGEYYYITTAQGGTAGPSTGHMVISARSKSLLGPWENSPYNPIIRTLHKSEKWWSKGHGTLVDTPDGDWFIMYHAYEKGFHTLGRQTLLEPIEWMEDGWFKCMDSTDLEKPIKKPNGKSVTHGLPLSGGFEGPDLGLQWRFYREHDKSRYSLVDNGLQLKAQGTTLEDSSPLLCIPMDHSYEVSVDVEIGEGNQAGLALYYSPDCFLSIALSEGEIIISKKPGRGLIKSKIPFSSKKATLKITNDCHDTIFHYREHNGDWEKASISFETSGYHHNVFDDFVSLRVGLFSAGKGKASFKNFIYLTNLEKKNI